jgi:hypothetical protein
MPDNIILETSQGTQLENSRKGEITLNDKFYHDKLERQYGSSSRERTPPVVSYNCHGLTFAVRRTGIHQENMLKILLADDAYVEIVDRKKVLPGDTIIYYGEDGDIIHSGIVVEEPTEEHYWIPLVVSKWAKYKELVHRATQCPYGTGYQKFYRTYGA